MTLHERAIKALKACHDQRQMNILMGNDPYTADDPRFVPVIGEWDKEESPLSRWLKFTAETNRLREEVLVESGAIEAPCPSGQTCHVKRSPPPVCYDPSCLG